MGNTCRYVACFVVLTLILTLSSIQDEFSLIGHGFSWFTFGQNHDDGLSAEETAMVKAFWKDAQKHKKPQNEQVFNDTNVTVFTEANDGYFVPKRCFPYSKLTMNLTSFVCGGPEGPRDKKKSFDMSHYEVEGGPMTRCGRTKLSPGMCTLAETGEFDMNKMNNYTLIPWLDDKSWCTEADLSSEILEAEFKLTNDGRLLPKSNNTRCKIVHIPEPHPRYIRDELFENKSRTIVFVGASHLRNIMSGLIALIRNDSDIFERHPATFIKDSKPLVGRYRMWVDRDEYHVFMMNAWKEELKQDLTKPVNNGSAPLLTVYHVWATTFESQIFAMGEFLPYLGADLIVTSIVSGHERRSSNPKWLKKWNKTLQVLKPKTFLYYFWPWGIFPDGQIDFLRESFHNITFHNKAWINYATLGKIAEKGIVGAKQFSMTWHSACAAEPNLILKVTPIEQFVTLEENCFDPFDRAYGRILLTLLANQVQRRNP